MSENSKFLGLRSLTEDDLAFFRTTFTFVPNPPVVGLIQCPAGISWASEKYMDPDRKGTSDGVDEMRDALARGDEPTPLTVEDRAGLKAFADHFCRPAREEFKMMETEPRNLGMPDLASTYGPEESFLSVGDCELKEGISSGLSQYGFIRPTQVKLPAGFKLDLKGPKL